MQGGYPGQHFWYETDEKLKYEILGPFPCLEPFQNLAVGRGQKAF